MHVRQGRTTMIAVLAAIAALGLALCLVLEMAVEQYGPDLWARLNGGPPPRTTPPPDPALANRQPRGNPAAAFSPDSYPVDAIRADKEGRTVAILTIDATGTPTACTIRTSSGTKSLDDATCSVAMRRVRYDPARDARGVAIASRAPLAVFWQLPDE